MESLVHTPLYSLETSFNHLLTSLTTQPTYSTAPSATQSLLHADESLTTALQTLYTHQKNYSRILQLRAEAERLEEQIRSTIRTCVDLRQEIGEIHPSILSDSSSEDGEEGRDVDYHTLLSFAHRIGKHNSAAAKEAEEESIRRIIKARKEVSNAEPKTNGTITTMTTTPSASAAAAAAPAPKNPPTNPEAATQHPFLPPHEKEWLEAESAMSRARSGMAFPAAESLRRGMLGRLMWIREQAGAERGDEAVEREVERLMAEAGAGTGTGGDLGPPTAESEAGAQGVELLSRPQTQAQPGQGQAPGPRVGPPLPPQVSQQQQQRQQQERKKSVVALDLDLWNEDEDEDD